MIPYIHHSNSSLANSKAHKWLPRDEVGGAGKDERIGLIGRWGRSRG